ncbi:MAG: putative LPS assembly protein LptD [Bryobacteraceae bacterium]
MFFLLAAAISGAAPAVLAQAQAHPLKADLPGQNEIRLWGVVQDSNDEWRYLKGAAKIETSDMDLSADQIDYNSDTHWAYARGHLHLEHFATGDKLDADHGEYNLKSQVGKFYVVDGTSPAKVMTNPGVLTTTNPFYFKAQWVDRIKDRYILHQGFITDCKMPKPWWTFDAPVFDVIPGERAIGRRTIFRLRHVPVLYLPFFYRPLGKNPRHSGFLTPNIGHSSLFGFMIGAGYYWAMSRSYDMAGTVQYFTARGPAFRYDFRGKPNEVTDFNVNLYGVDDQGNAQNVKQGGSEVEVTGRTQILGFTGVLDYNYLSSYLFREAFSYGFSSSIVSQNNSSGFLQRHFKDDAYTLTFSGQRNQVYESVTQLNQAPDEVVIQKLPSVEFLGRDQEIASGPLPIWFSFDASGALFSRSEPTGADTENGGPPAEVFNSGQLGRIVAEPRVMTEFDFRGFSLNPSITFGATDYTNSYAENTTTYTPVTSCGGYSECAPNPTTTVRLANSNLFRKDADFVLDLRLPTIERVFVPPKWLHLGPKVKHVIEAEAVYEYVTGINEFQQIIHFDATDILSNTNQLTLFLTNRLYRKDKNGNVSEILTWRLAQARYFDPTFGGAVLPGQRNVVLATNELTAFTFLDGARNYSPINSLLSVSPYGFLSFEWRMDYDPLRHKFIDQSASASARHGKYSASVSDTAITTNPLLVPDANQIGFGGAYGNGNRRGWNLAGQVFYDLLLDRRLFDLVQTTYNTDCCGFGFELRNYNLGIRNENQYLFSFSVANIGTFGSLQKQTRIF